MAPTSPAGRPQGHAQHAEEPAYFTVETLATFLDVPVRTVQKWAMADRIPGRLRVGRLLRFRRDEVERAALSGTFLLSKPKAAPARAWRLTG